MEKCAYVYILASGFKHLYIGITTNLELRMHQHRNGIFKGHTERYNIKHLVYYEKYNRITNAIAREKQLKKWSRIKKIRLIVAENPTWRDLFDDWYKPFPMLGEPRPAIHFGDGVTMWQAPEPPVTFEHPQNTGVSPLRPRRKREVSGRDDDSR